MEAKFTREHLTPEQNFKIVSALLVKKGILTAEEIQETQDQVVALMNEELEKNPIMGLMLGMMPKEDKDA